MVILLNIDYIEQLDPDADNDLNDVLNPLNALNFEPAISNDQKIEH